MPAAVRVVVAHEPRYYREALAAGLRLLLPTTDVVLVEPADLDAAVTQGGPTVVFCSALTETVERQALIWVLLYPEEEDVAIVGSAGQRGAIAHVELSDLLGVIAEAQRRAPGHAEEEA